MSDRRFRSSVSALLRRSRPGRLTLNHYYLLTDIWREFETRRNSLTHARPATAAISRPERTLLYWPAGSDNPYQELLYCAMSQYGWQAIGLGPEALFESGTLAHIDRPVVHLHWSQWITHGTEGDPRARLERALGVLDAASRTGGGTILSIHEPLPHEYEDYELEVEVKRELVKRASLVHSPHASTIERAREHYQIPDDKILVVELPMFDSVYVDTVTSDQARRNLRFPDDAFVVSFVGNIKPWKGIGRLLDGHDHLRAHGLNVHTVIAGRPVDMNERLRADIARANSTDGCYTYFDVVPDLEFGALVRAADLIAVPYDVMHNSAVLFMALSFEVPVLAPDTPATREACGSGLVELYDPRSDAAFKDALLRVARRGRSTNGLDPTFRKRHDPAALGDRFAQAVANTFG